MSSHVRRKLNPKGETHLVQACTSHAGAGCYSPIISEAESVCIQSHAGCRHPRNLSTTSTLRHRRSDDAPGEPIVTTPAYALNIVRWATPSPLSPKPIALHDGAFFVCLPSTAVCNVLPHRHHHARIAPRQFTSAFAHHVRRIRLSAS